ncbi:MAG: hypothetical protein AAFP19_03280 [Bacteroidota bacterium]
MKRISSILLFSLVFLPACLIKPPEEEPDRWFTAFEEELVTPIRNIHASPTQMYAVSDDEFIRLDNNNQVVERRQILLPRRFFGRPSLSDYVFVRVTRQEETDQVIEFHLTRNAAARVDVTFSELIAEFGDELFPEDNSRYSGAFNDSGTQFLLPTLNFSKDVFSMILFDIELNTTNTAFESVKVNKVIPIDEMPNDPKSLSSIRYINGHFYLASLNGAFRVSPQGDYETILQDWIVDFFTFDGKIFATGSGSDLQVSEDNGLTWERDNDTDDPTDLRFVEVTNEQVFTQNFIGFPFQLSTENLVDATTLKLNKDFPDDLAAYNNIRFFYDRYYLTVQKELYYTLELFTE